MSRVFSIITHNWPLKVAAAVLASLLYVGLDLSTNSKEWRGPVPIGVSIGASSFPHDARSAQQLIAVADRALYRVKRRGGAAVDGTAARIPGDRRRRVAAPVIDEDAPLADAV